MGTTITIGIVHDNGIAGDSKLARQLDQAVAALLTNVTVTARCDIGAGVATAITDVEAAVIAAQRERRLVGEPLVDDISIDIDRILPSGQVLVARTLVYLGVPTPEDLERNAYTLHMETFPDLAPETLIYGSPEAFAQAAFDQAATPAPAEPDRLTIRVGDETHLDLAVGQQWTHADPVPALAALFPVTIVGLVALRNEGGEVDLNSSSVFYRFATKSSSGQPHRTSPTRFLAAFPVQVSS